MCVSGASARSLVEVMSVCVRLEYLPSRHLVMFVFLLCADTHFVHLYAQNVANGNMETYASIDEDDGDDADFSFFGDRCAEREQKSHAEKLGEEKTVSNKPTFVEQRWMIDIAYILCILSSKVLFAGSLVLSSHKLFVSLFRT